MFGQPPSTPFGSPPGGGFGQPNATPGGFGTPAPGGFGAAPASTGFGTFGASAPAPTFGGGGGFGTPAPASGFGGGGTTFGSSSTTTTFGAPSSGGFGAPSSSPFGAPAPAPGGSLFGSPAPAPSGFGGGSSLFGQSPAPAPSGFGGFGSAPTPTTGGFGSTGGGFGSTNSGFGSSSNSTPAFGSSTTTSTFGAPVPTGGLFGAPAPSPSTGFGSTGFGGTTTTSTFGAPAPSPGGFGAPSGGMAGATGSGGTKAFPYQATNRQDGTSSITLHSITAMPQYQTKSFEELRFEDYSQGNKGTGGSTQLGGFGTFGAPAPAPTGGLFGSSAPAPAFGAPAPSTGGFGGFGSAPAPTAFGSSAPTPGAFGAPSPGGFGSTSSAFGPKPPTTTGLFGAPSPAPTGGLFGSSAPVQPGGIFGSSAPSTFGAPAPPSTGIFGTPAPAPVAPSSTFGSSGFGTTGAFGAPTPAPSGSFGTSSTGGFGGFGSSPATGGFGGFGSSPAPAPPAFGAPSSGGFGGFGASSTSGFGAKPPGSTGLFSQPAPSPAGGIFGQPQAAPPAFGAPTVAPVMPVAPPVGSVMPPGVNDIITSQLEALESKRKEMEERDSFKSQPSSSASIVAASLGDRESGSWGPVTPGRLIFPKRRPSPSSGAKIRPRGFASPIPNGSSLSVPPSLSKLGSTGRPMPAPESAATTTRLIVAPSPKPKLKLVLASSEEKKDESSETKRIVTSGTDMAVKDLIGQANLNKLTGAFASAEPVMSPTTRTTAPLTNGRDNTPTAAELLYKQYTRSSNAATNAEQSSAQKPVYCDSAPKLTKEGYVCHPSIEMLSIMNGEGLATVKNFSVERKGVGKVEWEGTVDVRDVDLDKAVIIEKAAVSVYMEDSGAGTQPPVGEKLNRPAIMTMEGIFPKEGVDPERYKAKVAKATAKMGAELIDYDPETGIWKLRVAHFSRYALDLEELDADEENVENAGGYESKRETVEASPSKRKVGFRLGERGSLSPEHTQGTPKKLREDTPFKPRILTSEEDDDPMIISMDCRESDVIDENILLSGVLNSYHSLMSNTAKENALVSEREKTDHGPEDFPEEVPPPPDTTVDTSNPRFKPDAADFQKAASAASITSELWKKSTSRSFSSNFDYGQRMGKSFRVGWGPNGSFFTIGKNGAFVRSKPKFANAVSLDHTLISKSPLALGKELKTSTFSLFSASSISKAEHIIANYEKGRASIADSAFSVLKVLQDTQTGHSSNPSLADSHRIRRNLAFTRLLSGMCASEVQKEINDRTMLDTTFTGDLNLAANVAGKMKNPRWSSLLASGVEARQCMSGNSNHTTKMPVIWKRCFNIVSGNLDLENFDDDVKTMDWKHRMAMQLVYATEMNQDISTSIRDYEKDAQDGKAPFPAPKHLSSKEGTTVQSTVFKLLKLGGLAPAKVDASEVLDPRGYSENPHDFSLAFYLAWTMSAMKLNMHWIPEVEEKIIDGYAAQLVSLGRWELAVQVFLCSLSPGKKDVSLLSSRFRKIKTLISRQHPKRSNGDKPNSKQKNKVQDKEQTSEKDAISLVSFGVPEEVFEEADAYWKLTEGNVVEFTNHLYAAGKKKEAIEAFEKAIIPTSLFLTGDELEEMNNLCMSFGKLSGTLIDVFVNLKCVADQIDAINHEQPPHAEVQASLPQLLQFLDASESTLNTYKSSIRSDFGNGLRLFDKDKDTNFPMGAFVLKALNDAAHMRLQLMAFEEGMSSQASLSEMLKVARSRGPATLDEMQRYLL